MRKSIVFFIGLLLLGGPVAPLWASAGEDACARGHHDVLTTAMQSCHEAPCCAMVAPHRDGNAGAGRLERSGWVVIEATPVVAATAPAGGYPLATGAGPPLSQPSQTTPVQRC